MYVLYNFKKIKIQGIKATGWLTSNSPKSIHLKLLSLWVVDMSIYVKTAF
jgi:hypothetical protein